MAEQDERLYRVQFVDDGDDLDIKAAVRGIRAGTARRAQALANAPLREAEAEHALSILTRFVQGIFNKRGGPGSGHFAHEGRPGERGGSAPGGGGIGSASGKDIADKMQATWGLARAEQGAAWPSFIAPDGRLLAPGEDHQNAAHTINAALGGPTAPSTDQDDAEWLDEAKDIIDTMVREKGFIRVGDTGGELYFEAGERITESQKDSIAQLIGVANKEGDYEFSVDSGGTSTSGSAEDVMEALGLIGRGGPGSGHFAHEGRPGERGGSAPGSGVDVKPPRDIQKMRWFHATDSERGAQARLSSGEIRPGLEALGNMAPVPGRVYATSDPEYALIYALGGAVAGTGASPQSSLDKGRYGYIFEIDGEALSSIQPDEDSIGEAVSNEDYDWLTRLAQENIPDDMLHNVMQGEYEYWAAAGKLLAPLMEPEQRYQMIRDGAHVANDGALPFLRVWRIDKNQSMEFYNEYASQPRSKEERVARIWELAQEIPVPVERGGAGSGHFGHEGRPGERGGSAPGSGGGRAAEPKEFHTAFERAFAGSRYTNHVTHYSEEELGGMRAVLLNQNGTAGIAVKDHGDGRIEGTALFNRGGGKGEGLAMLRQAIEQHGVNYVEAFGPYLPKLYEQLGFVVEDRFPFDPSQAPPGWNYEVFGTPDYFTMRLRP